jgi:hypothetical protein
MRFFVGSVCGFNTYFLKRLQLPLLLHLAPTGKLSETNRTTHQQVFGREGIGY